jgi:aminoglycoside phosphotransferase family enzyme
MKNEITKARENLQRFANKHKIVFEDKGEVGFGRECVGFLHGDNYIDYNPTDHENYEPIWGNDIRLLPPEETPNAYHKHDCLAVLVHGDYDKAILELNAWINNLEKQGEVYIQEYETKADSLQALMVGLFGHAVRIK